MTHGSVFAAVGQGVIAALADRLPTWRVTYEGPRSEAEMVDETTGELRFVAVDPEGDSSFTITALPRKYSEECTVTVVFERVIPRTDESWAVADDEIAEAFGELLDLLSEGPVPGVVPDGWQRVDVTLTGTRREGGFLPGQAGIGRRLRVDLTASASRC